jgi:hypothetical protein
MDTRVKPAYDESLFFRSGIKCPASDVVALRKQSYDTPLPFDP